MLALRKNTPGPGAELVRIDLQEPLGLGEIRVDVRAVGICGSDLHAHAWDPSYGFMAPFLPLTLGHEFSGIVASVAPDVTEVSVGDSIVCWPTVTCGTCAACSAGRPDGCEARRIIGLHRDGGFAESVRMSGTNALPLPAGLPLDVAALTEPLAVSINAVDVAEVAPGDRVVVLGPGPIGMGVALVAHARGADVLLAGFGDDARLALARDMGISAVADLAQGALAEAVQDHFNVAPDVVIEATGRPASVAEGLAVLRPGGVLTVVGIHAEPLSLDLNQLVRGKKQLRGAHDSTSRGFAEAISRLAADPRLYARMITHRLPLAQAGDGFALARKGVALKVMLFPGEVEENV